MAQLNQIEHLIHKKIKEIKSQLINLNSERSRILQIIPEKDQPTSQPLTNIISSISTSLKKLNKEENKKIKSLVQITSTLSNHEKIKIVLRCVDIKSNEYEVQFTNGNRTTLNSKMMINFNGHIDPAFLQFVEREHLESHFLQLDLDALNKVALHLGCGKG